MEKAKVYFSRKIDSETLIKLYELVSENLVAPVAIKLHSGEEGNQNYLQPEFWKDLIYKIKDEVLERRCCKRTFLRETFLIVIKSKWICKQKHWSFKSIKYQHGS